MSAKSKPVRGVASERGPSGEGKALGDPDILPGSRGRASVGRHAKTGVKPTMPHTPTEARSDVNRSVNAGQHRGDRRDTSSTYTTNVKHASRGSNPRKDPRTRKGGPKSN